MRGRPWYRRILLAVVLIAAGISTLLCLGDAFAQGALAVPTEPICHVVSVAQASAMLQQPVIRVEYVAISHACVYNSSTRLSSGYNSIGIRFLNSAKQFDEDKVIAAKELRPIPKIGQAGFGYIYPQLYECGVEFHANGNYYAFSLNILRPTPRPCLPPMVAAAQQVAVS